jgi:hypothetical protein
MKPLPKDLQSVVIAMETKSLGRTLAVNEAQDLITKMLTRRAMPSYLKVN